MPTTRRVRTFALLAVLAMVGAACHASWSQWGGDNERQGDNAVESQISTSNVSQLHHVWSTDLGGYINAAPIEAGDMSVLGGTHDVLYVGTEQGEFYALTTDGEVIWHRNLGTHVANCPDTPGNVYGVQASAVFDRATNRVYAMGGAGQMYAMDASTGAVASGWPVTVDTDPAHNSVYGAPNLFNGFLYMATGSHCDQQPYYGHVTRIDTQSRATIVWYTNGVGPTGPGGGGIWGWGGVSIDPADGNVYVATGNLAANPENTHWGDSVVRLTPDLKFVSGFALPVLIGDDDLGSTPMLFQAPNCPPQFAVEQKNGTVHLFDRNNIAAGPRQTLTLSEGSDEVHGDIPVHEFIGVPAYSPKLNMVFVSNPTGLPDGSYTNGMVGFRINSSCALTKSWNTTAGVKGFVVGTPTIANGVVYYADGGHDQVHAFNAQTGQELWNTGTTVTKPMFTEPLVINGKLYMGAYDNKLHAWGL
jgi:outer membrane protein assembly factor BamB